MTEFGYLLKDPRVLELLALIGTPYSWGAGDPKTPWPADKYDCSGFVQGALVHFDMLKSTEPDRNAKGLANICDAVTDEPRFGDLAFYGNPVSHVTFCLGRGWTIGANGGGRTDFGNNPKAFVKLEKLRYRNDLLVVGRLKGA